MRPPPVQKAGDQPYNALVFIDAECCDGYGRGQMPTPVQWAVYARTTSPCQSVEERLVQVAHVGEAALFPLSFVVHVVGHLNLAYPLDPLVAPFALCNEHEGEPALGRNGYLIHLVRHQDVIVHDVVEKERCAL